MTVYCIDTSNGGKSIYITYIDIRLRTSRATKGGSPVEQSAATAPFYKNQVYIST